MIQPAQIKKEFIAMRNGEPQIYSALATLRNGYTLLQWGRIQMALVFNTIAIPLALAESRSFSLKLILSIAGIVVHVALLNATLRADNWIKYWDQKMAELEQLDQGQDSGTRVLVFSHSDFQKRRTSRLATRRYLGPVGAAIIVFWIWNTIKQIFF